MSGDRYVGRHRRQTTIAAVDCQPLARTLARTRPRPDHNQRRRQQQRQHDVTRRHDTSRDFRLVDEMRRRASHVITRAGTTLDCSAVQNLRINTSDQTLLIYKRVLINNPDGVVDFLLDIDPSVRFF